MLKYIDRLIVQPFWLRQRSTVVAVLEEIDQSYANVDIGVYPFICCLWEVHSLWWLIA